jgi:UDP-N-acetylglucosamine--N-acetylmuramyl-(pentapeptide) pyrophosphoryl-undecaprenol N-acetylglucosamine transferase
MVWFWKKWSLEEENYEQLKKNITNLYFCPIFSWKRRREKSFSAICKNLWDLVLFSYGILQSLFALKKYHIDVVFCKWGYVALPVVFAAKLLWIRIVVHESDVHPWLVNRIASKYAKKTFTGFDNVLKGSETVGQILSEDLLTEKSLSSKKETNVLVMWGSQWAKNLYEALAEVLKSKELDGMHFDVVLW